MPPEPSVTSACEGPRSCTLRYSSALLPKSFERPGPKSVSPATYCSGVEVVVWWRWIVDMRAPYSFHAFRFNRLHRALQGRNDTSHLMRNVGLTGISLRSLFRWRVFITCSPPGRLTTSITPERQR